MANMFDAQYQPLKRCPQGPLGINFATYWYRFRYSKDFWICSKCYQDNIADTFLTSLCERFYDDILPGTRSICDFNNARCKQLLHAYMQHRQIGDLLEYGKRRAAAGMCTGTEAVHGGRGLRWYSNAELPGFVACEACFHDYILASPFGEKFFLRDLQEHGPKHAWSCDVVVPFIRQALFSGKPWALIVAAIQHRMSLPACGGPKQATKLSSRKWYQPVKPFRIDGMRVCEACFLDRVAALPAASNFAEADIMPVDAERFWFCELVDLPISICTQELLEKDYPRWHSYINEIITKPMCTRENITDGEWYGIVDPQDSMSTVSNADVCSACYTGLMRSTDCEGVFRRLAFPSGTTRCCDFSPMSSRSPTFLDKWRQMLFTRDPTPFQRWASKIAPLPVCTKMQSVSNQRWWGTDDFCFCEACFEEVGRGSYFAPSFPHQGGILESANCDMYRFGQFLTSVERTTLIRS